MRASALFWRSLEDWGYPTAGLILDFCFFFLAASSGAAYGYWVSSAFYAFVLLSAVTLHRWWKTLIVATAAILLFYALPALRGAEMMRPALIAAGILGSVLAIQREYLEERLSNASRQTVLYRYDAERAREAERQRIAADFHDGPLQSFISFQMRLEIIRKLLLRDQAAATEELLQLQELCKAQVNELRTFRPQHASRGCGGQPDRDAAPRGGAIPKGQRHPHHVCQRRVPGAGRARGLARIAADRARGAVQRAEALGGHRASR